MFSQEDDDLLRCPIGEIDDCSMVSCSLEPEVFERQSSAAVVSVSQPREVVLMNEPQQQQQQDSGSINAAPKYASVDFSTMGRRISCDHTSSSSSEESESSASFDWEHLISELSSGQHHQHQQRAAQQQQEKTDSNSKLIWGEWDVPLGRNQQVREHIGNVRFRGLVEQHRPAYQKADRKSDKTRIAFEIYSIIHSKQGRFLDKKKMAPGLEEEWFEIEQDKALSKISQALRKGTRPTRKQIMAETMARHQQLQQQQEQQQQLRQHQQYQGKPQPQFAHTQGQLQEDGGRISLEDLATSPFVLSSLNL